MGKIRLKLMNKRSLFFILLCCLYLQGCAPYPVKAVPNLKIIVKDAEGKAVKGAIVNFIYFPEPSFVEHEVHATAYNTDEFGKLSIKGKRIWHIQLFLPDGMTSYAWSLCVEKEGYKPEIKNAWKIGRNDGRISIELENSDIELHCALLTSGSNMLASYRIIK